MGEAAWALLPDGAACWLALSGALAEADALIDLFSEARRWPWPIKPACRAPGAPPCWRAEVRLTGAPDDGRRVAALVVEADRWLAGVGGAASTGEGPPSAASEEAVVRGLGPDLKRTRRGFRRPAGEERPALTVVPAMGEWVLRCPLVRVPGPPQSLTALASLHDFMAVANDRSVGCRMVADDDRSGGLDVAAETRLPFGPLVEAEVRAAADRLSATARRVGPGCEVLIGQPRVASIYRERLLGAAP